MHTRASARRSAPIVLALVLAVSGCALVPTIGPSDIPIGPTNGTSPAPQPEPEPDLAPLDPALVGQWGVDDWLDTTGSHTLTETYLFTADGLYQYTFAECRSSTDCSILSQEQGYAQSANGVLTLSPQTASDAGQRAWPYRVGYLHPDIPTSLELHLLNPDGSVHQIFYG